MKLYEINAEILQLTDQIEFDEETGEILCDIDAIYDAIGALQQKIYAAGISEKGCSLRKHPFIARLFDF